MNSDTPQWIKDAAESIRKDTVLVAPEVLGLPWIKSLIAAHAPVVPSPQWIIGIPSCEAVKTHESDHPRPDGIRLGRITVGRIKNDVYSDDYVKADDRSFGEWICHHVNGSIETYVSILRLKEVDGEVLMNLGFTVWHPLVDTRWAAGCRYFPVTQDGLPEALTPVKESE